MLILSEDSLRPRLCRRELLAGASGVVFGLLTGEACARTVEGALPWSPGNAVPPAEVPPGCMVLFHTGRSKDRRGVGRSPNPAG